MARRLPRGGWPPAPYCCGRRACWRRCGLPCAAHGWRRPGRRGASEGASDSRARVPQSPLVCPIVADQHPVAEALEVLFSLHETPAAVAPDAAAALDRVRSGDVGVVLQDMNFAPGETSGDEGAALFHAIRNVEPAMPVLLMTAFTSLERAVSLVKAGATDYFGKPWDDARLVTSVRELLAMREARHGSERRAHAAAESFARG